MIFYKFPTFCFSIFTFSFSLAELSKESLIHTLTDPSKIFNSQYYKYVFDCILFSILANKTAFSLLVEWICDSFQGSAMD